MSDQVPDEIRRRVTLGAEVEHFLNTSIGKYLIERAEDQVESATEDLKTADAENPRLIRELQHKIAIGDSIQRWLAAAITDGYEAERQYVDTQSPD